MTEPSSARPVPGPPRPGPGSTAPAAPDGEAAPAAEREPFTGLEAKPVAEHVAVFEAEHSRLQRELGTIDQL
ncbi:MAG: hypothetical protein ACXVX0_06520 [Blastococcus sp.]